MHLYNKLLFPFRVHSCEMGVAVAQWLRHYATNRKVAGWIPAVVIGIFN
jgi:hypothetical protein